MKLTMRGRFRCVALLWLSTLFLPMFAQGALAQTPPFWSGSISAPMPGLESSIVINLRQQGVLSGVAPITVDILQYEVLLLNGQPNSNLIVSPYDANPN